MCRRSSNLIRLGLTREPRWIDLGCGVSVLARPLTTAVHRAATATALRKSIAIAEERGLVSEAGGSIADIPDPADQDGISGLRAQFMLQALAIHAIAEWNGVGNADGTEAASVTPGNIIIFIRDFPLLSARFESEYLREISDMAAEKNGSGRLPTGTLAAAPDTAGDANRNAVADARTTSTPPPP